MGGVVKRLRREERGQNMVELALLLPLLLLLVFGIIDFARAFNYKDQATQIANETARWVIVNQLPGNASPNLQNYKDWAQSEVVGTELKNSVNGHIKICFADSNNAPTSGPVAGGLVTVTIPASITPVGFVGKSLGIGTIPLNGKAQMRVELPATNGTFGTGDSGC